jgi:hypothetical protein
MGCGMPSREEALDCKHENAEGRREADGVGRETVGQLEIQS